MGGGRWDDDTYTSARTSRRSTGVDDFTYSKSNPSDVHANLDPKRINSKPFGKLESRDSDEHPESTAVLFSCDVTGSNIRQATVAQSKLPTLMNLLAKYLKDPQLAVAANDDVYFVGPRAIQISDFESDNRVDEHIRNTILVGQGGGNDGESYDLILYAAARKTVLDCFEKRGHKGYLFLYADEPIFEYVKADHVQAIFGDTIEGDIPIADIIEEVRKQFHIFVLWPAESTYTHSREQYLKLFGEDSVITLQAADLLCEVIGMTIGANEGKVNEADSTSTLLALGVSAGEADAVTRSIVPVIRSRALTTVDPNSPLAPQSDTGAARL